MSNDLYLARPKHEQTHCAILLRFVNRALLDFHPKQFRRADILYPSNLLPTRAVCWGHLSQPNYSRDSFPAHHPARLMARRDHNALPGMPSRKQRATRGERGARGREKKIDKESVQNVWRLHTGMLWTKLELQIPRIRVPLFYVSLRSAVFRQPWLRTRSCDLSWLKSLALAICKSNEPKLRSPQEELQMSTIPRGWYGIVDVDHISALEKLLLTEAQKFFHEDKQVQRRCLGFFLVVSCFTFSTLEAPGHIPASRSSTWCAPWRSEKRRGALR